MNDDDIEEPGLVVACVTTAAQAERLLAAGYCPVECAFGERSVVDELELDHHGELSGREAVSLRAWRDLHGRRRHDPRFVTAGAVDADAGFAMAALAGLVPAPTDQDAQRAAAIVEVIEIIDTDPIGRDLLHHPGFGFLRLWSLLHRDGPKTSGAAAVHAWSALCRREQAVLQPLLDAALESEQHRRMLAEEQLETCRVEVTGLDDRVLVLDGATVWGFDIWYARDGSAPAGQPEAWDSPIVFSRNPAGTVTVGTPNVEVAERLLGPGGLRTVLPELQPPGWGGRESIGGSPRGEPLDQDQVVAAARKLATRLSAGPRRRPAGNER